MSRRDSWRGRAFGLDIDSRVALPGLRRGPSAPAEPGTTAIDLCSEARLTAEWPSSIADRIAENASPDGRVTAWIDRHPPEGYLFSAPGLGGFRLAADGSTVLCAPAAVEDWRWQRYLVGQVLPFASLLRGHEIFHASAVAVGGRGVAFVGDRGAGKTTVAVNLHALGAEFLTDDVLALELRDGRVLAHPGLACAKVRRVAQGLVPRSALSAERLGEDGEEIRLHVDRAERAVSLSALHFLRPTVGLEGPVVKELPAPDIGLLLRASFNFVVQDPERLRNQLEICVALARTVQCAEILVPADAGAGLARLLWQRLQRPQPGYEIGSNPAPGSKSRVSLTSGRAS